MIWRLSNKTPQIFLHIAACVLPPLAVIGVRQLQSLSEFLTACIFAIATGTKNAAVRRTLLLCVESIIII